jgi:hypothetical protein
MTTALSPARTRSIITTVKKAWAPSKLSNSIWLGAPHRRDLRPTQGAHILDLAQLFKGMEGRACT